MSRRQFLGTISTGAAGVSLASTRLFGAATSIGAGESRKAVATVRAAFLYPPTESLKQDGYYSWPGSTFDAEGRQRQYSERIRSIEQKLGMRILLDQKPLDDADSVARFINEVKQSKPDGLLLIPFKK